jgi:hypothetical protein
VTLRPKNIFFCQATAGDAASQIVKVMGPKAWRATRPGGRR